MHVCLIASSVKIITTKRIDVVIDSMMSCTDSSHQDGLMLRLICIFLGCDMPIQLVLSSEYDDYDRSIIRLFDYITDYKICNILCLNK